MIVYRLSKKKYCNDLSGKGAEKFGGRWNSKGTAIVYTSDSRALCTAEVAVHFPLGIVPQDYYLNIIEISDKVSIKDITLKSLSKNWKSFPHAHSTQIIGDEFINDNKYLILKVPSAVIQGDFNYLINPNHSQIDLVKVIKSEHFEFDKRLFKV